MVNEVTRLAEVTTHTREKEMARLWVTRTRQLPEREGEAVGVQDKAISRKRWQGCGCPG
jgi:hypothetical protein